MTSDPTPIMDVDPDLRVCAVCGSVADQVDGKGWLHLGDVIAGTQDHPVVPVRPGEVFTVGHCDFCYALDPTFVLPVRDFELDPSIRVGLPDGDSVRTGSKGDWAVCSDCATLIERDQWNGILRRIVAVWPEAAHPEVQQSLRRMHRRVRANITGALRPFVWPQPE